MMLRSIRILRERLQNAIYMYNINIYIYIDRQTDKEREREIDRYIHIHMWIHVCIYIYTCVCITCLRNQAAEEKLHNQDTHAAWPVTWKQNPENCDSNWIL